MQATSRVWLKGQNNRVLKVNVLQQRDDSVTLFLPPLLIALQPPRQQPLRPLSACPPAALSVRRCCVGAGGIGAFHGPENKPLCLPTASGSCLFPFFCDPGSGDATRRSLIAPPTPPHQPSLPSVSVRLCVSSAQALPLTGGGQRRSSISGRDDSARVSAPVLTEVRGTWTTPRQLIHATLSSQGRSAHIFTKILLLLLKATRDTFGRATITFLGPIFHFLTLCKYLTHGVTRPRSLWVRKPNE